MNYIPFFCFEISRKHISKVRFKLTLPHIYQRAAGSLLSENDFHITSGFEGQPYNIQFQEGRSCLFLLTILHLPHLAELLAHRIHITLVS